MKKFLCIIVILVLIFATAMLSFGCKSKISSGDTYHLYTYDAKTDKFVKMGASLTFGEGLKTYEYTFREGDLTINGPVEHTSVPDSYIISCADEVVSLVTKRYRDSMVENGASQSELEFFDAVSANFSPQTQYFSYDGKLFDGDSVELFRCGDEDPDSFEGVYRMDSADTLTKLRGTFAYTADEKGEYTVKSGRYTVSRGILTIISLDDKGNDRYQNGILMRKRYLMAKITIPADGELISTSMDEQVQSSKFISKIKANLSEYSGKTIAVLCDSFYSNSMK